MTTEMYGSPLGFRSYDEDQAKLSQMAAQTRLADSQARHQDALVGLNNAQADTMLRNQRVQEQLAAAMQAARGPRQPGADSAVPSTASAMSKQLAGIVSQAEVLSDFGQPGEALKLLQGAAAAGSSLAGASAAEARQRNSETDRNIKQIRLVQEALTRARSPATAAEALLQLEANPETREALAQNPKLANDLKTFNRPAIAQFLAGAPALIQQQELALKQSKEARDAENDKVQRDLRKAQTRTAEAQKGLAEARTKHLAKVGAPTASKGVGTVRLGELDAIAGELARREIKLDTISSRAALQEFAEQSRLLWRNNTGFNPDQARARVIDEAIARGEIEDRWGDDAYVPKQGSVSKPIPAADLDASKFKPGLYYQNDDGRVFKYLGPKRIEVVTSPSAIPTLMTGPLGGDEEEE